MYDSTLKHKTESVMALVPYSSLKVRADEGDMKLIGATGTEATLTNYAFDQVSARASAPAAFLRRLPAPMAADALNVALSQKDDDLDGMVMFKRNGGLTVRCITGENYQRIWNAGIVAKLQELEAQGWRVPPARPAGIDNERTRPATAEDVLKTAHEGMGVKVGDMIAPAGLYASDRDMFAFLVDDDKTIDNPLSQPLARGFFVWNSEVGDKVFGVMTFLYDAICGNHIVWGAQNVNEVRIRHVGDAKERAFSQLRVELKEYANESATETEAKIKKAQTFLIAEKKEDVLETLFGFIGRKKIWMPKGVLEDSYALAEATPRYGDPRTPWAITQGISELSQQQQYAEKRVELDRSAGKLLQIAF